ncbi:MAG: OmpA family protein [Paracoccaceae bacterium]
MSRTMTSIRCAVAALGLAALALPAVAQQVPRGQPSGQVQWGVWVDPDGCQHWFADGGLEQYQLNRLDPKTGRPVCARVDTCFSGQTDTMFHTDSANLTHAARARLQQVFRAEGVFGFAVYGHTDSRASLGYNQALSERRARAVADVGRSVGAVIQREIGFGETRPIATNHTHAGMAQNRRVEVVCYRW